MKKIENHHNSNTTYIIGKTIVNGCQSFTIEQLDSLCEEFNVSDKHKQECLEAYTENQLVDENYNILVNDNDCNVRMEVAKLGTHSDILVNDESWLVRREVAKLGTHSDILVNDESWLVRAEVAKLKI